MNDLIYRQDAIKAVGYYHCHSGDKLLFADNALKELPSAHQWITCSERLPEEGKPVLGSFENEGDRFILATSIFVFYGEKAWSGTMGLNPIAWMPLPEPFEEDANETD